MRVNKSLVLLLAMFAITPFIGFISSNVSAVVVPEDVDSPVGVVAGDLLKYNIDQFSLTGSASPSDVTLPDMTKLSLYVKVLYINESFDFGSEGIGTYVHFAIGFMVRSDISFEVGSGVSALTVTLPAGSASPSIGVGARPSLNHSSGGPAIFCLNDDWAEHEAFFTTLGMTVTNTADTFSVEAINGTGTIEGEWRKSDGVLTHMLMDNIYWSAADMDLTGVTFEFNLASKTNNPLAVSVGDEIQMNLDAASVGLTGSGDLYNETEMDDATVNSMLNEMIGPIGKMEILEVAGAYYIAKPYSWDPVGSTWIASSENVLFNGFFGCIQTTEPPLWYDSGIILNPAKLFTASLEKAMADPLYYQDGVAPAITPDWDIYQGHMIMFDALSKAVLGDVLEMEGPSANDAIIHEMAPSMGFDSKQSYKYFMFNFAMDIEGNTTDATILPEYGLNEAYTDGMRVKVNMESYIAFHQSGIWASARAKGTMDATSYGTVAGSINMNMDFKMRNPDYNPPDNFAGGFIPGFTWLIAIPAVLTVTGIAIISRKRK